MTNKELSQPEENSIATAISKNSTVSVALVIVLIGVFWIAAERVTSLEVNLQSIKESQRKTEIKLESFATKSDISQLHLKIGSLSDHINEFASRADVEMIVEAKIANVIQDVYRRQSEALDKVKETIREEVGRKEPKNN